MEKFDYLIIGTGIAGLTVALEAAKHSKVAIVSKNQGPDSSSNRAQGGIASVFSDQDKFEYHISDTLKAGDGLCRQEIVEILAKSGPAAIQKLIDWGVEFTKAKNDEYHLVLEGGHSHNRILHAKDLTGQEIMRALTNEAERNPNITIYEKLYSIDLICTGNEANKKCVGVEFINLKTLKCFPVYAKNIFLCTGGIGNIFLHTTNPRGASGDGIAMAFRAGNTVEDIEFMQFHPTSLYNPGEPTFLISEAVRGHGGILKNHLGEEFMNDVHPLKSLAPRDIVARAIDLEMKKHKTPHVYLDITSCSEEDLKKSFPNIFQKCLSMGINMSKDWVPVVPAAHYICGGIKVNSHSQTNTPHLFACGECSATGVHGANRLASNSLLESVVFSRRGYEKSLENLKEDLEIPEFSGHSNFIPATKDYDFMISQIRHIMWDDVGIVRKHYNLENALKLVSSIRLKATQDYLNKMRKPINLLYLRNISLCAELVIINAINRRESRGLHYSVNYPKKQTSFKKHLKIYPSDFFGND